MRIKRAVSDECAGTEQMVVSNICAQTFDHWVLSGLSCHVASQLDTLVVVCELLSVAGVPAWLGGQGAQWSQLLAVHQWQDEAIGSLGR